MNTSTILISLPTTIKDNSNDDINAATTAGSAAALTNGSDNYFSPGPGGPYTAELIVLFFMLGVFFVLGVVGNALAFYIYYQKRDKTTSTLFILSLAATDFFTCLVTVPYTLATEMLRYWLMYDVVCKAYMFFLTFNIPLSSFIMVAVGFDRYFCICHPFLHAMTVKRAKICLVCLTLLSLGLGVITALSYGVYYLDTQEIEVEQVVSRPGLGSTASSVSSAVASAAVVAFGGGRSSGTTVTTVLGAGGSGGDVIVGSGSPHSSHDPGSSSYSVFNGSGNLNSFNTAAAHAPYGDSTAKYHNDSEAVYTKVNITSVVYFGMCVPNQLILSTQFADTYQKIYAALFLLSFIIIALLYALIYRSILIRRAWKAKRKRMSCYASTVNGPETAAEETQLTNINNGNTGNDAGSARVAARTSSALRDRMLYANIKTAAMLFVVTVVFIISFLPSWLIGLGAIPMNHILFYIFFLNNVANPFIYAFMNRTFRDDLKQLLKRIKNRLSGW